MKASCAWLRALVPGLDASPAEIAERLTAAGLEVEDVREVGAGLDALEVVAVRRVEPHPSRSGLVLVTVDRGGGREQRVVCGAANVPAPGGLCVLAPLGATLPAAGLTVGPRVIGGVTSEGMLCSEAEMGLGPDADGILVIESTTASPGTPFLEAMSFARDTVLDIGVTPNRPDALGHVGLAREVAALCRLPWKAPPTPEPARLGPGRTADHVRVDVEDAERCPHYGAQVVVDVHIAPSPTWLRWRLAALGVRPISNVVDVTNLVLLEAAQPMHAFDLDRVRGGRIVVRRARPGERMTTLDGQDRALDPDDLLICDGAGPVALAGVMGGAESEIAPTTTRVLLECAWFAPRGIRRTSRRHGLVSESSFRFERGVDRSALPRVLDAAAAMLTTLASGAAVPVPIHAAAPAPPASVLRLRSRRLDAMVGAPVPFDEACDVLGRLGFAPRIEDGGADGPTVEVTVPGHRPDVAREADLVEEVARVRGLGVVPTVVPPVRPQPPRDTGALASRVRAAAVALGLSEAVCLSIVSSRALEAIGAPRPAVRLLNPLAEDRSVMRTSLLPGLLDVLRLAGRRGERRVRVFGVGSLYLARPGPGALPDERPAFAAVLAGPREAYLARAESVDALDAKGIAVEVVERATGLAAVVTAQSADRRAPHLHPRGAADISAGGRVVGRLGPLHPDVAEALDLDTAPVVVEICLRELGASESPARRYVPIPRLPAVVRDVALVVREDVPAGDIERAIALAAGDLCERVELFDLFRGGAVPEGRRSLAFHVVYRDPRAATNPAEARTLTDAEVDARHAEVVRAAREKLGAEVRQ